MRVVVLCNLSSGNALPYTLAFKARGHDVTAIDLAAAPDPELRDVEELRGVEVLSPMASRPEAAQRAEKACFYGWAAADRWRTGPSALLGRLGAAGFPLIDRRGSELVARLVLDRKPDVVFSIWGWHQYRFQMAVLRRKARDFVMVQDWNTFPEGDEPLDKPGVSVLDKRMAEAMDVRVHASERELAFMRKRMDLRRGADIVEPDAFNDCSRPKARLPLLSAQDGEPHLAYHALYARPRQDQIQDQVQRIAAAGIHVHFGSIQNLPQDAPRLHQYKRRTFAEFTRGDLFTFSTQFDAALVTVNAWKPIRRFANWMPTRFMSGVASGIPIALKQGVLGACEDFLREHGNGFLWTDEADLKAKLHDRDLMAALRKRAIELEPRMTIEARMPKLERAIADVSA